MIRALAFTLLIIPFIAVGQKSITDERDGVRYEIVKLGNLYWMKENLRYQTDGSLCLEKCDEFRFYSFESLENVCPQGWRLPTVEDWDSFTNSFEDAEKVRMLEDNEKFYRVDFLDSYSIFKSNVLNIKAYGRVEGDELRSGDYIDYWTVNPATRNVRFHMHITPYSIMGHAHKHHLKANKPEEFRLFPVRCVCESNKLAD